MTIFFPYILNKFIQVEEYQQVVCDDLITEKLCRVKINRNFFNAIILFRLLRDMA